MFGFAVSIHLSGEDMAKWLHPGWQEACGVDASYCHRPEIQGKLDALGWVRHSKASPAEGSAAFRIASEFGDHRDIPDSHCKVGKGFRGHFSSGPTKRQ